jgi:NAD(P)-dependent dehydrogenase (short-subunit alcohol dehydrogenase family)
MTAPTALVTGAARGVGRATCLGLAAAGWRVVAGVRREEDLERRPDDPPGLHRVPLDVTAADQVRDGVARAQELAGGALACVVNNAGYAVLGAQEDADLDEVRAMFETNVFGAAAVTQAALPAMREAGRGTVVLLSSVGARISNPLLGFYHASKYALTAMGEALAVEVRPFGLRVVMIEPGMVDTDFPRATRPTGALTSGTGPYIDLLGELRAGFAEWRRRCDTDADAVARVVLDAVREADPPFRVVVGDDARHLIAEREASGGDEDWQRRLAGILGLHSRA